MTKFDRKANVIHWSDIKDRMDELAVANMDHTITLLSEKRQNNFVEMDELKRIDDILEDTRSYTILEHLISKKQMIENADKGTLYKTVDQYIVDLNLVKIQVFGETYYY